MEVVRVGLPIAFGRPLFLKCYEKSHSQLLLCVGPEREKPTRLEVLFKDVVYIGLREKTPNASLRFASGDEKALIQSTVAPFNWRGRRAFLFGPSLAEGIVIARGVVWAEDSRAFGEPSSLMTGLYEPEPERAFGAVE